MKKIILILILVCVCGLFTSCITFDGAIGITPVLDELVRENKLFNTLVESND